MNRTPREFKIGDKLFLRVKLGKRYIKTSNLATIYVGPFEIIDKVNPLAYKILLPPKLSKVHNVFHISFVKKYVPYTSHIWDF